VAYDSTHEEEWQGAEERKIVDRTRCRLPGRGGDRNNCDGDKSLSRNRTGDAQCRYRVSRSGGVTRNVPAFDLVDSAQGTDAGRPSKMVQDRSRSIFWRVPLLIGAMIACVLFAVPGIAGMPQGAPANRLIHSASPYLLQHAHNPVDWYPWGEEAIAKAKKENKLIFLSIGYSTCYWCHVAERAIYSNPAIAALMNQWFVSIKVDREERPDLDQTYMLARKVLTGSGGWPNNLFLTPDRKPFFAGSYFPPEDQGDTNGFPTILKLIHDDWEKNPAKIKEIADQVQAALSRANDTGGKPASVLKIMPANWLATARDQFLGQRDKVYGGLDGGGGTKFAQAPVLDLLLTDYRLNGTAESLQAVAETLDAMAFGGIHDQLGGGMHRYSTEPTWSVPHFEKMLYDNAQLLGLYAAYYAITHQPLARDMAADLAGYLARHMTAPDGGFYTAEDADIKGKEGETYLWTRTEMADALGSPDTDRFFALYELTPLPNEPGGPGVLRIRRDQISSAQSRADVASRMTELAPLRAKLLEIRGRRPQPARDDKIVVALNGLAIAGLARAGKLLGEPQWIATASRAGAFLWQQAFDGNTGRLRHHLFQGEASGEGFLDDYALLGLGYLALGDATGEPVWESRAQILASSIMARFIKPDGLLVTSVADANLVTPAIDLDDHDTPSGTSAAYALLAQLGKTEPRYAEAATKVLAHMADKIAAAPANWASLTAYAALYGQSAEAKPEAALDSAAHVKAVAQGTSLGDHDEILVTLTIDPGYHVNANPASIDYLLPTVVTIPSAPDAKLAYPAGQVFKPKFSPEGISVYEGSVEIRAELPKDKLASAVNTPVHIEVQACTTQICLPPATLTAHLNQ
jgi:uncharacterized protein